MLLAIAVLAVELLYFERQSIEDGLHTIERRL